MALPSPTAAFPDMTGIIEQAKARGQALAQSAWADLSSLGPRPQPVAPQASAQAPQGYAGGMQDWSQAPAAQGQGADYKPSGTLGKQIIETAQAIGADPLDLATAISYETAGTFNPMQMGPTTQWGQHGGLIQFGEPQRKRYGVDFSSPEAALTSQLGPNGAVAKYFRASGFKPGMSGLDLYSTINAGTPGRYNASDANNGGAPGSVADKWNNQMTVHRQKAAALLGIMG